MSTHDDEYQSYRQFDDSGYDSGYTTGTATSVYSSDTEDDFLDEEREERTRWHGGLDLGLLILRLGLGGTMGLHGLQKVFGLFNGPGIDGFAKALSGFGFTSQTTLLSWITGIAELGGGALLVLGLFTPIGAAAILGVAANVVYVKHTGGFFVGSQGKGFEYEAMLGVVALSLLFTGPGRVAIDVNTPWRRKPVPFGIVALLLAAGATVAVILLFR